MDRQTVAVKRFVFSILIGVTLATLVTIAIARALLPAWTWDDPTIAPSGFGQQDALDTLGARLGTSPTAWQLRRSLQTRAQVESRSSTHWTVRLGDASWSVHVDGPRGPYAEPDNDMARELETEVSSR